MNYNKLEEILEYKFINKGLLVEAITHPSLDHDIDQRKVRNLPNYERLEFLGDSVLSLIITEILLKEYKDEPEGLLAKRRAALVSGQTLAQIALELNLGSFLIMTEGESAGGGRENNNNLENALEAIIGALYLDSNNLETPKSFIYKYWFPIIASMHLPPMDPKSSLQEWAQQLGKPIPRYVTINSSGPAHAPLFTIEVQVDGLDSFSFTGSSKRIAEKEAARLMLEYIEKLYNE